MLKLSTKNIIYLVLYALPNTILTFGIVFIINNVLAGNEAYLKGHMWIVFISIIVYTYLLNIIFQKRLNKFAFHLLYENEKKLFNQVLKAPLERLEKFGPQRFFTVVEDLRAFAMLPMTVTHTVNSLLMLFLCILYMFTLSTLSALIVIGLIIMVAACYFIVMGSMSKRVETLRNFNEQYFEYVDDVMKGFKELKVNFDRRQNLMNRFLVPNRDQAGELDFRVNYIFLSINLISQYGLYFVIAVILFVLPSMGLLEREAVIAYVVIILFISGPINNLVNLQQMYTRLIVANGRIKNFMKDFEGSTETPPLLHSGKAHFSSLEFRNISFKYETPEDSEEASFGVGPIDLTITQGETIFIIGGNGSGKSTFINLLTGLYPPEAGSILLDGRSDEDTKGRLQDLIAAVFSDTHIFSNNYDNFELENNKNYHQLLKTMQLDQVVANDEEKSARKKFSKGQTKRMAMIFALLENKPILVLDEWAADQDPHFRKYFYEELLSKLKKQGKTIIAVTHDDAYFEQADRIIKFDYGTIAKDISLKNEALNGENLWYKPH